MDKNLTAARDRDEELAVRAAAGSRAAFEGLVTKYAPRLFYFLKSRSQTDQDIEDLVQETFLRAFQNIKRYDSKWKFSTWLYTMAFRIAVSRLRTQKTTMVQLDPENPKCPAAGPPEIMMEKEEEQRYKNIWNIAITLNPGQYRVLWLRYVEGMTVKEIARAMKKTQVGVRALLHRARLNLGEKLRTPAPSDGLTKKEETSYALLNL